MSNHKQGRDALGGHGQGVGPCSCGQTDDLIQRLRAFGDAGFPIANEAATLLGQQAAALEAVGAEPVAWGRRYDLERLGDRRLDAVSAVLSKEQTESFSKPLYGPEVVLRLTEALRQRDALSKNLARWAELCERGHGVDMADEMRRALKEVGHE